MHFALQWTRWGLRWLVLIGSVSVSVGLSVAVFLALLDIVIVRQWHDAWLLWYLPIAGLATGWLYQRYGQECEMGASLIYGQIKSAWDLPDTADGQLQTSLPVISQYKIPHLMAPLVLIGTLITHLFGGSAGREGTAIQMGGSLTSFLAVRTGCTLQEARILLLAGIASGLAAVFGTPLAAAIFAIEVVGGSARRLIALPVCLCCAVAADLVTTGCGIAHTPYQIDSRSLANLNPLWLIKLTALGIVCGFVCWLFTLWVGAVSGLLQRTVTRRWLRPAVGGCLVILLVGLLDSRSYLGLGVESNPNSLEACSIVNSFHASGTVETWSWLWKLLFTGLTVGSGFKGGEATPLFFIGATLGHVVAQPLGLAIDLTAGLGFVALFAAATRTPLACSLMAIELFANNFNLSDALRLTCCALLVCSLAKWMVDLLAFTVRSITPVKPIATSVASPSE
jgi:H+/Cl- antiporter ClcA